jgi:hypothetical protein
VQVGPGDITDHLDWIAQDIVRRKPDVLVCIGDFWDLPSLSSHDAPGSAKKENARFRADLDAGHEAMARLMAPIQKEQARIARRRIKKWPLRLVFTEGNHENRADRIAAADPVLTGLVGAQLCNVEQFGFERHKFLEPVEIDSVYFSHYWQSSHSARPIGGTIDNRLNKLCVSFVAGHEQGLRYSARPLATGKTLQGIVAGSCYLGTEDYRGPQAKNEWRGTVVLHDVRNGDFDPMFLSLRYLCKRYTGEELLPYMQRRYSEREWTHLA